VTAVRVVLRAHGTDVADEDHPSVEVARDSVIGILRRQCPGNRRALALAELLTVDASVEVADGITIGIRRP
jgi:hypothetical protein